MLFFNANFICYYFYPTKKREEPFFTQSKHTYSPPLSLDALSFETFFSHIVHSGIQSPFLPNFHDVPPMH